MRTKREATPSDMRIATFNLQNLRLRTRDGRRVLDGASDQDRPEMRRPTVLAQADRVETAKVIKGAGADVLALQEVFDLAALDFFHDRFLLAVGAPTYPHRICLDGNDGRGLNVAALSRRRPVGVKSHAKLTGADLGLRDLPASLRDHPIFRRDCLELTFDTVSLFVCHFKAPYPDVARAAVVREAEASAVRRIIEARFADPASERWVILGDFNEPSRTLDPSVSSLEPLKSGFAIDLADRLAPGTDWTYEMPGMHLHSRPDRILVSPRLATEYPGVRPEIIRSGMEPAKVGAPHASDHALIHACFPGL